MLASAAVESIQTSAGANKGAGGRSGGGGEGSHGARGPGRVHITGMLIALGGILMFFSALISAWVVRRELPDADWQPLALPHILWLNTLVLALSGVTLAYSRRCLAAGREADYRYWWGITTILGAGFLAGQLVAWRRMSAAGLLLATSPSSSFFYVFTAAHALHVLGGIAALLAMAFRSPRQLTPPVATQVVALYWHFLAALWFLIFAVLWLGG
ncbi:MAG TPA: cytochrome c oxidase subunit 3 [Candidatus Acidoferrales bacterium]|nr:cytochrome c oxidase subunit 3 [Candidatus Acidoferrales bacterium]